MLAYAPDGENDDGGHHRDRCGSVRVKRRVCRGELPSVLQLRITFP